MASIRFQVLDWHTTDYEDEDEDEEGPPQKKYIIKMFGMDEAGRTVSLNVTGFEPYFYVKLEQQLSLADFKKLEAFIRQKNRGIVKVSPVKRKDMWGFNNNTEFWFVKISFRNVDSMRRMERVLDKGGDPVFIPQLGRPLKLPLYESNVEPFIRFIHKQDIQPCGWVEVKKFKLHSSMLATTCAVNAIAEWKNVKGVSRNITAPFKIASFDLECTSSHGDFPVPKKSYLKLARELGELYRHRTETSKETSHQLLATIKGAIMTAFGAAASFREGPQISQVFPKRPPTSRALNDLCEKYATNIIDILKGNLEYESDKSFYNDQVYDDDDAGAGAGADADADVDAFNHIMNAAAATARAGCAKASARTISESVLGVNTLMTTNFPELEGDPIIQIGCVFQTLGSYEFDRYVLTLDTCDPIDGATVIQCATETELLLRWRDLIRDQDPDVVIGYNIFGFDMVYLYERAKELRCEDEFMQLGRIKGMPSKYVEKNRSSSALGDNLLKLILMDGRVIIDLMKVVQSDHKLDTYKLDAVANNFMKGGIKAVLGPRQMRVDNINGIQVNSYLKLGDDDEKHKVVGLDAKALVVTLETGDLTARTGQRTWGLSKDDISPQQIFEAQKGTSADRALIAKYCIQDCVLCNFLMLKLQILANNFGMANVCTVPLSYIFMRGQGVKIFSLVSKQCNEDGFLVPTKRPAEEAPGDGYEGAIVLDPVPGIYIDEPISVLDYASLYPSSMISENISHDSIILDDAYDNLPGYEYLTITYDVYEGEGDKKRKVDEKHCRYAQFPNGEKGIIPRILQKLLTARKTTRKKIEEKCVTTTDGRTLVGAVKGDAGGDGPVTVGTTTLDRAEIASIVDAYDDFQKAVLDGLQLAYKVTANSVYGQVGARTSPVHMKELAASTTATGRNLILSAKAFLEKECGAKVIYGDSVMPYTPITVKSEDVIRVLPIEELAAHWMPYPVFRAGEPGFECKQQFEPEEDLMVWTHHGWARIRRVIRHMTRKRIYRVLTHTGLVDVTEDHSLLSPDGEQVKPGDLAAGNALLHSQPDWSGPPMMYAYKTADHGVDAVDGCQYISTESHVVAQQFVMRLQYYGFRFRLDFVGGKIRIVYAKRMDVAAPATIKRLDVLYDAYEGYVYDLETEAGVFHAGVGNLVVKNTDSVFAIFPNEELRVDPHTGAMERVKLRGKEALQASIDLAIDGSGRFKKLLKKPHDLEYEKTFFPFIILSKKRYIGNLYEHDPKKFKQKSMGVVLKRRDNASILKHVYGGIIDIILNECDVQKSLTFLNESLSQLVLGKVDMDMLVITKTLKGSYKNPQQIAHKVLADRMRERDPGSAPQTNDRVPYVYINVEAAAKKGVKMLQGDKIEHPQYIVQNKLEPDYKFYITNQLMKPIVQVYALALTQLKGFRKGADYYDNLLEVELANPDMTPKKARDKIARLKEKDAQELLFGPFLQKLENKKNKMSEITSFFKPLPKLPPAPSAPQAATPGAGPSSRKYTTSPELAEDYADRLVTHALKRVAKPRSSPAKAAAAAAAADLPKAAADLPKAAADLPKAPADLPKAAADLPKAAADLPKAAADLPKAAADLPKAAMSADDLLFMQAFKQASKGKSGPKPKKKP